MGDSTLTSIIDMREQDPPTTWAEIGEILQITPEAARGRYRTYKKNLRLGKIDDEEYDKDDESELNQYVEFLDKKHAEDIDWRELLDLASTASDVNKRMADSQRTATIRIHTDRPVAVLYTGDWHLGDSLVRYDQWLSDMQIVLSTDGLYMVDMGDDYQNMRQFKNLASVLNQVLSPKQQVALMKSLISELTDKGKLLAKIGGNHDEEFDQRIFGEALQSYLYRNTDAPVFPNKGLVKLKVGEQEYTNLLFHKSRFRSILRPAHGAFREWQLSYPAEVVVGAHDHTPAFESWWGYSLAEQTGASFGGEVFLMKIGTYQDSDFGWRYFHNGGFPLTQTIIYYPDEHKKLYFADVRDAIKFLGG